MSTSSHTKSPMSEALRKAPCSRRKKKSALSSGSLLVNTTCGWKAETRVRDSHGTLASAGTGWDSSGFLFKTGLEMWPNAWGLSLPKRRKLWNVLVRMAGCHPNRIAQSASRTCCFHFFPPQKSVSYTRGQANPDLYFPPRMRVPPVVW